MARTDRREFSASLAINLRNFKIIYNQYSMVPEAGACK